MRLSTTSYSMGVFVPHLLQIPAYISQMTEWDTCH